MACSATTTCAVRSISRMPPAQRMHSSMWRSQALATRALMTASAKVHCSSRLLPYIRSALHLVYHTALAALSSRCSDALTASDAVQLLGTHAPSHWTTHMVSGRPW